MQKGSHSSVHRCSNFAGLLARDARNLTYAGSSAYSERIIGGRALSISHSPSPMLSRRFATRRRDDQTRIQLSFAVFFSLRACSGGSRLTLRRIRTRKKQKTKSVKESGSCFLCEEIKRRLCDVTVPTPSIPPLPASSRACVSAPGASTHLPACPRR